MYKLPVKQKLLQKRVEISVKLYIDGKIYVEEIFMLKMSEIKKLDR